MSRFLCLLSMVGLAACGEPSRGSPASSSPIPAREAMAQSFIQNMKSLDLQYENLHGDVEQSAPAPEIRSRLTKIRRAAEGASVLPYRESESENRDLKRQFDLFLSTLARLEAGEWKGEEGVHNVRALGAACEACHGLYRTD
ncbi:MAG: hypothetical protein HY716_17600 [Planctomycetes bacterium]|nr:hypothetical protein [Planctomycetota bacterium]